MSEASNPCVIWECIYDHGNGKFMGEASQAQRERAFAELRRLHAEVEALRAEVERLNRPVDDQWCIEFMCMALRHVEYKRGSIGPTCDDIRLGIQHANAARKEST